jgi:hypothetical protein
MILFFIVNGEVAKPFVVSAPVTAKPVEVTLAIVVPALCNCRVPVLSAVATMPELVVALIDAIILIPHL